MKKIVLLSAFVALMLSGCVSGDDYYAKFIPVEGGMKIYNAATSQNKMGMQQAHIGLRLALLLAEAKKHPEGTDLNAIVVDGINVKARLLGASTTLTKTDDGVYKITFSGAFSNEIDQYARAGSMLVLTNNKLLSETTYTDGWQVTCSEDMRYMQSVNGVTSELLQTGGETLLHAQPNGKINIIMRGIKIGFKDAMFESSWNSSTLELTAPDAALCYSDCKGKAFELTGTASGASMYTLNNTSSAAFVYTVDGGKYYSASRIFSGTETAKILSTDYDMGIFPSPLVTIEWSLNGQVVNGVISYNGHVVDL